MTALNPLWVIVGLILGTLLARATRVIYEDHKEKKAKAKRDNPRNWATVRLSTPCPYCERRSEIYGPHSNFDVVSRLDRGGIYSVRYCSYCNGATYKNVTTNEIIKEPATKRWSTVPRVPTEWPRPK